MLPAGLAVDVITVERAAEGSGVRSEPDWDNATTRTVSGCSFQEGSSSGGEADRAYSSESATLYAPTGADLKMGDRVTFGGRKWTVVGDIVMRGANTPLDHVVATMTRWVG